MNTFPWRTAIIDGKLLSLFCSNEPSSTSITAKLKNQIGDQPNDGNQSNVVVQNDGEIIPDDYKDTQRLFIVYTKRFWMLLLLSVCLMLHNYQSYEYVVATNVYSCYYGVSHMAINSTLNVYAIAYPILLFPTMYFLERHGLRIIVLTGLFVGCLSLLIQCGSLNTNGFPVVISSQTLAAMTEPILWPLPARLASTWFGPTEVSRATALAVNGFMVGGAVAFVVGPYLVAHNCTEKDIIYQGQAIETFTLTACHLVLFVLILLTFEDKPPTPPSLAEATRSQKHDYCKSMKNLMKNVNFLLLLICNGIHVGVFYALTALLNQMLSPLYPKSEVEIGWIGLSMIAAGLFGSYAAGYVLDYFHKFKETMMAISILCFLAMCCYTGLQYVRGLWLHFITIIVLGFLLISSVPTAFEMACEFTYPEPESSSSSLINGATTVFTMVFIFLGSMFIDKYGVLLCNLLFCACLLLSCIAIAFVRRDYKRTKQNFKETKENCPQH